MDSLSGTSSFDERFNSYTNWPQWAAQEPRTLARAGFRFRNERDLVKCDYCGGKFYNWKKEDDPVVEHRKYFPNCRHVSRLMPDADGEDISPPAASSPQRQSRPLVNKGTVSDAIPSTSSGRGSTSFSRGGSSGNKVPVPPVTSSDAKWLRSRMDLPFIQMVLAKGYKRRDVKKVLIANRLKNREVSDAVSLVKQIFELEDKEKRSELFPPPAASSFQRQSRPLVNEGAVPDAIPSTSSGRGSTNLSRGGSSGNKVPVPPVTSGDAKWLRSRMDLPFIQIVLAKGYKRSDVKKVLIANRLKNREVSDAVSLAKEIFELEDKEKRSPNAAWNALKSDPMASSEGIDDMDGVAQSGDNAAAIESEAKYRDPEQDARYRCVRPDEQRDAKLHIKVGNVPESITSGAAGPGPRRNPTSPAGLANVTDATDARVHDKSGKALCLVCKTEVQGCLFMPCNHLCTCPNCAVKLPKCPICEQQIIHRLRVYLGRFIQA